MAEPNEEESTYEMMLKPTMTSAERFREYNEWEKKKNAVQSNIDIYDQPPTSTHLTFGKHIPDETLHFI